MLNKIEAALKTVDANVCYGSDRKLDGTDIWDYIVFRRAKTTVNARAKIDCSDVYEVYIVRRDFVPEDDVLTVLAALTAVPGLKAVSGDVTYTYTTRPGTKAGIEIAALTVAAPRKCVADGA